MLQLVKSKIELYLCNLCVQFCAWFQNQQSTKMYWNGVSSCQTSFGVPIQVKREQNCTGNRILVRSEYVTGSSQFSVFDC